jgi:hypothetical protein
MYALEDRLAGCGGRIIPRASTKILITTESPEGGTQDVYFNRGVAASHRCRPMRQFASTDQTMERASSICALFEGVVANSTPIAT